MAVSPGGSTTPTVGAHIVDSSASTAISHVTPMGYRFQHWTGTTGATFGNANANPSTVAILQNATVTAVDTIIHFVLTMAAAHGSTSPSIGAHVVDSAAATAITHYPPSGWAFSTWSGAGVTFGSATTNPTTAAIGADATATANDTSVFTLISITPNSGDTSGGTAWSIVGIKFGASKGTGRVRFAADLAPSITLWSDTLVQGTTPAHVPGSVNVSLIDNAGDSSAILSGWTYTAYPHITSSRCARLGGFWLGIGF
jgi:hypothetical protein